MWIIVCLYVLTIFIATPYLPSLLNFARSRWSSSGISHFVLSVEIILALLIIALGIGFLIYKKKKNALLFLIYIGCFFLLSSIIYKFIPNPYEFTHFPEYAILSILIVRAIDKGKGKNSRKKQGKNIQKTIIKNSYFISGLIAGIVGTGDEVFQHFLPNRFFDWYDILLNILGGTLGLLIFWGVKR